MIEVFKTNVNRKKDAEMILALLMFSIQDCCINFDLDDCDKILRVENRNGKIAIPAISQILHKEGFLCEVLTD